MIDSLCAVGQSQAAGDIDDKLEPWGVAGTSRDDSCPAPRCTEGDDTARVGILALPDESQGGLQIICICVYEVLVGGMRGIAFEADDVGRPVRLPVATAQNIDAEPATPSVVTHHSQVGILYPARGHLLPSLG